MKLSTGSDLTRVPVKEETMLHMLPTTNVIPQHHSGLHLVWTPINADANGPVTAHWIDTPQLDEGTEQEEQIATIS